MLIISLDNGKGTIDRAIKSMKEKDIIERIGSSETGYWKVKSIN